MLWDNLHCPSYYDPINIYYDSTQNYLYSLSSFSDSCRVSRWNGTNWTNLPFTGCSYGLSLTNFQGDILLGGGGCYSILKWDGVNWQPFQPTLPNGNIYSFLRNGTDLYVGGTFDSIGSAGVKSIAKWNGTSWNAVGNLPYSSSFGLNTVRAMTLFQGNIVAGGLIADNGGNVINIIQWDGFTWSTLGSGIHGGMDDVLDMIVYNNELYVAGTFTIADGNYGNYIQKWDGFNWSSVGGGVIGDFGGNGQIFDLEVYDNFLYAVGVFSSAGGIPAPQIAKWDGTNWCSLGTELTHATCLTKSTSDLYVGGGFKLINGDSTGPVTKWIGTTYVDTCGNLTGIENLNSSNTEFFIYPNPATNNFTIEFNLIDNKNVSIELKNILGQTIKEISTSLSPGKNSIEIDLSDLPKGVYFVQLQSNSKLYSKKVIRY